MHQSNYSSIVSCQRSTTPGTECEHFVVCVNKNEHRKTSVRWYHYNNKCTSKQVLSSTSANLIWVAGTVTGHHNIPTEYETTTLIIGHRIRKEAWSLVHCSATPLLTYVRHDVSNLRKDLNQWANASSDTSTHLVIPKCLQDASITTVLAILLTTQLGYYGIEYKL